MQTKRLKKFKQILQKIVGPKSEVYLCGDCDYIADSIHDFNDHTHSPDEFHENSPFSCNFCDKNFQTLGEVMKHNKTIHTSSVQHCKQYLENDCSYGKNCWFLHCESLKNSDPSLKCNLCEQRMCGVPPSLPQSFTKSRK